MFGIEYRAFEHEFSELDQVKVSELCDEWREMKKRRADVPEDAFETLVRHDVKVYLLVQSLRKSETTDIMYGYNTWWLTLDRTAFRLQKQLLQKGIAVTTPVSSCMSPDFLLRYLSIQPRHEKQEGFIHHALPLCAELAAVGLIPPDLREAAQSTYEASKNEPRYLQRRKLRDLINSAKNEQGELFATGIDAVEKEIDETLTAGPPEA